MAAHTQPQGFLVAPKAGQGPGVLVLHPWWGLNNTIKGLCTRLADSGFVAFAPDLYHGKVAKTIPEAEALGSALDANHGQAEAEVFQAAQYLFERVGEPSRGLAIVGLSLGAYYGLQLSAAHPEHIHSVVLFYGTTGTMELDYRKSKAAYLGHFAENDPYETKSNVDTLEETLKRASRPVTFHRYSGTSHWFFEPDRVDAYNETAANLAWDRTLAFLQNSPSA